MDKPDVLVECDVCKTQFMRPWKGVRKVNICSPRCHQRRYRATFVDGKRQIVEANCKVCGKPKKVNAAFVPKDVFCGRSCYDKYHRVRYAAMRKARNLEKNKRSERYTAKPEKNKRSERYTAKPEKAEQAEPGTIENLLRVKW